MFSARSHRWSVARRIGRGALAGACGALLWAPALAMTFDELTEKAQALASRPWSAPDTALPPVFQDMSWADFAEIHPRRDRFRWRDLDTPFRLTFHHQGMHFDAPVIMHEVSNDTVEPIDYDPADFQFATAEHAELAEALEGHAGFRILYPINEPDKFDEIMSVLGASYFRVIGEDQVYGLSGRGLAIDTGLDRPEEFPAFREFWLQPPEPGANELTFLALLDSPSATGAYRYTLMPGRDTVLDVQSRIVLRKPVERLGIAPLTSMFLYGPQQPAGVPNFRPAIHDSNGLAIQFDETDWLWRPLQRPARSHMSEFDVAADFRGFGLLQRGHEFWRYQDLADRYDRRPSAWVTPTNDWGPGRIRLFELSSPDETHDNMVAFWSPTEPAAVGEVLSYDYRMRWTLDEPALMGENLAWVDQTFLAPGEERRNDLVWQPDGSLALHVDFTGGALGPPEPKPDVKTETGENTKLRRVSLQHHPALPGWRLTLHVDVPDPKRAATVSARLEHNDHPVSETWRFRLPPDALELHDP